VDTTCVALDLELLDSPEWGREILEIGAARFRGDRECETYAALVQTRATLTHRMERLTGLSRSDLAEAIPLPDALESLRRFIGSTPVVGQSIQLDVEQLRRAGLVVGAPLLDTFELASLLLPGMPAYDLDSVARALDLEVDAGRHRALRDARLAMRVFLELKELVRGLDLDTLMHVNRLSLPLNWPLRLIFAEAERQKTRQVLQGGLLDRRPPADAPAWLMDRLELARTREALVPSERRSTLDLDGLERSMRAGGEVAARLDDFEERPEQIQMLRVVAQAFNDSASLLVEAGTGTGKSLAYVLPAARYALANNRRVVVSTNTINLQDQLFQKELPAIRRATRLPLKFSVLKGRSNYLCLGRWTALLRAEELSPAERMLLIKTLLWLPHTTTGDRAELRLTSGEEEAWSKVCALADACSPQHCAYSRAGRCFLARARRLAEASHLIVVNHSLLLADLASRSRVLPEYRHLIIDEAHHLEDEATAQLGWRIGLRELVGQLERLWEPSPSRPGGIVPEAAELLRRSRGAPSPMELERVTADLGGLIATLSQELPRLFDTLARFVANHGVRSEGGIAALRLSPATRTQPAWSEVEISWDDQHQRLLRLQRALGELLRTMEAAAGEGEESEALSGELAVQATFWDTTGQRLSNALLESDAETIAWLSAGRGEEIYVNAAPLHVGEHLRNSLFQDKDCVILTSATLTTEQSFRYIRERLGIEDARELMLGSPFDYRGSVMVYLPVDLPEPNSPGYQHSVERITARLIAALEGRTLVLFTSYSQLRATYEALREPLEARQILLLGQRMDGASRTRLLESFKQGHRVALMGTTSFWEGVDVVGEALSCLVMARLPFTIPSDPVFQARSELFEDPFGQYAVPQAILRFRQGFGRLIRSRSDRGAVVVLDRRLKSRAYGHAFLRSLPGCEVREGPASETAAQVRNWLGSGSVPVAGGMRA
jgi:predicted DnaQ family exonuclease/DinG family helicase